MQWVRVATPFLSVHFSHPTQILRKVIPLRGSRRLPDCRELSGRRIQIIYAVSYVC